MPNTLKRVIAFGAFLALLSTILTPVAIEAMTVKKKKTHLAGKDERTFVHPTSRCLTKAMSARNAAAVKQMESDIQKYPEHANAIKIYREKLTLVWSAMSEPYCGYGSRGIAAVQKSFSKSVQRIRAEFLADVKTATSVATQTQVQALEISGMTVTTTH